MDNRRTAFLDRLSEILKRRLAGTPAERLGRAAYRRLRGWATTETIGERYERLTFEVMTHGLDPQSNTVDVGCHNGTVLRHALQCSPGGRHFAFEPLPYLYRRLVERFPTAEVSPLALSDRKGVAIFQHIVDDAALSGFYRRPCVAADATVEPLEVATDRMDVVIPLQCPIRFIKIDVEGAEEQVLLGAERILSTWHPLVAFEFGVGAPEAYGTTPADIWQLFHRCGLTISRLDDWLAVRAPLTDTRFSEAFARGEFFFLAHPGEVNV